MGLMHGFELVRQGEINELDTRYRLFRHARTGAELLSLENTDENKVFGAVFRTPPSDSTGVAHIMEHSVLCGSEKYPLKEPFVELIKGSLHTFLNAFTYPDKTCYPVASTNLQDFYNLVDVYLDAVFHPLIPPETLQQEGWHYELDSLEAPMAYKGVVFNEMKGAYSSPDNLLGKYTQQSLFPDTTYGVDSGGDPRAIPDLTYEQFKSFHETFYHPSNGRFFFYGDDDPDERLRIVEEALGGFERLEVNSSIPLQPPFEQPRSLVIPFAAGEDNQEQKGYVTVNWLLPETTDPFTRLALRILSHVLVGTPAAPLRKALIDSGLGEDVTGGGLDSSLRQMTFSTGLKGVRLQAQQGAQAVEELIFQTLQELAQEGIDPGTVAASLNTVEFRLRENNYGSFPRGIVLMLSALGTWLYEGDPIAALAYEAPLNELKSRLASGEKVFEDLIRRTLLENRHHSRVVLEPDPALGEQQDAEERQRLEAVRAGLSEAELQQIVENTRLLKERQEKADPPEALATIPSLKLSDLPVENRAIPTEISELQEAPLLFHDLSTNGIVYLDLGFNLHALPQEMLPYVGLFARALFEMGTEGEDFVRLSQRIGQVTGGLYASPMVTSIVGQPESAAWLFLRGKATLENSSKMLDILRDVLKGARLDNRERFLQMVLEEKSDLEAALAPGGHRLVGTRLRAQFSEAGWAWEQMSGISSLFFLRELAQEVEENWPAVLEKLETMRRLLLQRTHLVANVTVDAAGWSQLRPELDGFLGELPGEPMALNRWQRQPLPRFEGLTFPAQVNYVGQGANLYELGYELDGSIQVINKYLGTTWLWERVRVQGGAYGGFCQFDRRSGIYSFLSYRDPNLLGTLKNYAGSGPFLRKLDLSQEELTKSIIGAIGDIDAYQLPDAKGRTALERWLAGDSDEARQRLREQVLSTTVEDFHALGEVLERVEQAGSVVVLGSKGAIEKANRARPGWLAVQEVM